MFNPLFVNSISLKSNIGPRDVEKLVAEVRQRVEYQDPDGKQRVKYAESSNSWSSGSLSTL